MADSFLPQHPGELYRGARLAAALDRTADHPLEPNALEREFLTASQDAAEQQARRARNANRRLRGLLTAVAALLVVSLVGGILAVIQRGQAQEAEAGKVNQRIGAQSLVEGDLDLSLLLARQAVAIDDTPQTRGYLLSALARAPSAIGILSGQGDADLTMIAISPDGNDLAVGGGPSDAGYVGLIDARTREREAEESIGGRVTNMAFTDDGSAPRGVNWSSSLSPRTAGRSSWCRTSGSWRGGTCSRHA